jgi:mannose-6-phosphate isomerase-like protein (cupin superfamily)
MNLKKKRERVYVNTVTAEKSQLAYIKLEPGEETNHSHSNEQLGYIIKGQAEIKIGDEISICGPGDAYFIPSNIKHGFKVINNQNVEYIEIFSPPKEENKL